MVAVFGTMCADAAHIELKIPYAASAALCAAGLTGIFVVWYLMERTPSIHSITTPRRGVVYWAAPLATSAMGAGVGVFTAYTLPLRRRSAGMMFSSDLAAP